MMDEVKYLNSKEIDKFVDGLDKDNDGCISYSELEEKLDKVNYELEPNPREHHLHHKSRRDEQRHEFLRSMISTGKDAIPVNEFKSIVATWKIPSLEEDKEAAKDEDDYLKRVSFWRKLKSYWAVDGPEYLFLVVVIGLQIGLGVWQCIKYAIGPEYQAAFGWGVGLAKAAAGALYPTLFFLVLSMSRWFATAMRRFYHVSRFINWDLSQSFHVKISIVALALATLHAIGHLSGTFVFGSSSNRQPAVGAVLGPDAVPRPYVEFIRSRPGWTGLTALSLFYSIALLSMPCIRKWSYEIFQLGHLLMFPMIGLLMAHGTLALLQYPVLGFVLAGPTVLVFCERLTRILAGFHRIPAKLSVLDDETVLIKCTIPGRRIWKYKAGQYVFLQVPQLSFFQWHPFTISTCIGREMSLHIKTDGDWTAKLRDLEDLRYVGLDGPFGAPAQRFYDFDQAIIVGAGIGVTPFSGILNDLQQREDHRWSKPRNSTSSHESESTRLAPDTTTTIATEKLQPQSQQTSALTNTKPQSFNAYSNEEDLGRLSSNQRIDLDLYRRVDFHWIVRDKNYLSWFSSLLNKISSGQHNPNLDIRILNHLTKKRKDLSVHVFRWLLETHRTEAQPVSPITGLVAPTSFGRPDFPKIMNRHYEEMMELFARDKKRRRRVGVFFCGAPVIGHALADLCHELTVRGREEKSGIEYHFMIEVFG